MNRITLLSLLTITCAASFAPARSPAAVAHFDVNLDAPVGTTHPMNREWRFKPDYEVKPGEVPQTADAERDAAYRFVPVPQMLSRIQWWLDDSEDFRKWEQARLDRLGFDTERSDSGWYRATIVLDEVPKDRRLWIEFDGVAMRSKTYINGHLLGNHDGMFSRFGYDLTPHLKAGDNALAVWVSMEKIPPTSGNLGEAVTVNLSAAKVISMSKGMFGPLTPNQDNRAYDLYGIWQPVKLIVRGGGKIDDVWFQPTLTGAQVQVEAHVPGLGQAKVHAKLTDVKTNEPLVEWTGEIARAEALPSTATVGGEGLNPRLWTPAEPNLYRLDVTIASPDGGVFDRWSQNVGFRTFEVKGNQFHLNGKPYWLRGANQLPYGKNPWDPAVARKLIQYLHDGNINSTRTHCTPWNEAWLDAADEVGLAVSIEGIRPWAFAGRSDQIGRELLPPPEIFQHWLMENADVIKRCRNHPSVFLFTVGNEMLLRDAKNLKKWELLSQVTKQTRSLAPWHPIVASSDYVRDREFYDSTLKPVGIDDGDVDDLHRYNGWYSDSPFVIDSRFEREAKATGRKRPMIGQEMSTGYPDLDTGLPVLRYTRDLLTPQAWVGNLAYPGNDPKWFLDHHARVTKRWAEQLRWQRGAAQGGTMTTAGFSLFSAECWFRHSFLPDATPYPAYEAVRYAFAPVGVALETTRRRFWGGDTITTNVHVTHDDDRAGDLDNLEVFCELAGAKSEPVVIASLPYYATATAAVTIPVPAVETRTSAPLVTHLMRGGKEISRTVDAVELFPKPSAPTSVPANVIVIAPGEPLAGLAEGQPQRQQIEAGATAIVFSPAKQIVELFPNDLLDVKTDIGEFADFSPCAGTKLAENLQPLDLKWWARKGDWRAFVAGSSHRLKPGGRARELIRFIPSHAYIAAERVPEQYRAVMSEIPLGKGRLWICDLAIAESIEVDPIARLFAHNLHRAAADPESTKTLPPVPSHAELLKGVR